MCYFKFMVRNWSSLCLEFGGMEREDPADIPTFVRFDCPANVKLYIVNEEECKEEIECTRKGSVSLLHTNDRMN
jgi:hypothetical protein